jgi:glycosyltransferase involved in cell wall biosynthesis/SAM-dependent methyltransferase
MTTPHEARSSPSGVTVAITTFNHARFLGNALDSIVGQSIAPDEILVVDDGSDDDPAAVVARYPGVRLVRQENQGLAAARNTALQEASQPRILFLDADDALRPRALELSLRCFEQHPDAGFVYGGHIMADADLNPTSAHHFQATGPDPHLDFLEGNAIGMHATVLYDRAKLLEIGGFDPELPRCEDYDVYLRMSRRFGVGHHPDAVAFYRMHGENMSRDSLSMLRWAEHVHRLARERGLASREERRAWRRGRRRWRGYYAATHVYQHLDAPLVTRLRAVGVAVRIAPLTVVHRALIAASRRTPPPFSTLLGRVAGRSGERPVGSVRLGDLDTTEPVSLDFGFDRGTPVDRHYIENFLEANAPALRGRALEVGDANYCERFGKAITQQDVLHVSADNPKATIIGDIAEPGVLPPGAFDCIVLTQTLHLVYDMPTAIAELHRALKPGGVLLLTVPGISQLDRGEWGDTWYWALTPHSARRLFEEEFGPENVVVAAHGNVYAATGFLQGLAVEELDPSKLAHRDPAYPVTVTVRAQRAEEAAGVEVTTEVDVRS